MLHQLKIFLPMAEKIYNRKTTVDILHHICVNDSHLTMTDLETFVQLPVNDKRSYTLPIQIIKKVLAAKPKTFTVELMENNKVKINYDHREITIPTQDVNEYPSLPTENFEKTGEWTNHIFQQLARQSSFASTDMQRPALTGVYVRQRKELSAVATNGHILEWNKNMDKEKTCKFHKDFETIIPGKFLKLVSKYVKTKTEILKSKSYLQFNLDYGPVFYTRIINEPYVDFERAIPTDLPHTLSVSKEDLLTEIKAAKAFSPRASFASSNGTLELSSEDLDSNLSYVSSFNIETRTGDPLTVKLSLDLLEQTVNAIDEEVITWNYRDAESPNIFTSNDSIMHLLMPVR